MRNILLLLFLVGCSSSQKTLPKTSQKSQKSDLTKVDATNYPLISNTRQITFEGLRSGEGYFSADGTQMVFQSERHTGNPFYQIYLNDLNTGDTSLISTGKGNTTCAWIHPSGQKILYSSTHLDPKASEKGKAEYERRKSGKKEKYSWAYDEHYDIFAKDLVTKELKRLTKEVGYDAEGSYSPDGTLIAFASNREGYNPELSDAEKEIFAKDQSYFMDIYIMNSDGSNVKRLTDTPGYDGGPFFSADGKKITWRRFSPDGHKAEIFTMNIDGSEQTQVTHLESMSWAPFFHPSGDYIVFTTNIHGYDNFELYIVDSLGKQKPVRVTTEAGFDGLPVFTPDGDQLSWTRRDEKGFSQIYLANWDDRLARKLLKLPARKFNTSELSPRITQADLEKWVYYLASEELQGRGTGTPQELIYTNTIADFFATQKLKTFNHNKYVQPFIFNKGYSVAEQGNRLSFVGQNAFEAKLFSDWLPLGTSQTGNLSNSEVIFVGHGLRAAASGEYKALDDYADIDVENKIVMILSDMPDSFSPEQRVHYALYTSDDYKMTLAKNLGAKGVLFLKDVKKFKMSSDVGGSTSSIFAFKLTQSFLNEKLKIKSNQLKIGDVLPFKINGDFDITMESAQGHNVVGMIDVGASKSILIGAHGDHLSLGEMGRSLRKSSDKSSVHFGADDNASGTAAVLELAHYFSRPENKKQLKVNLIFAIWSGEEIGLLGSKAFIEAWKNNNPRIGLNRKIESYINLDMVGRYQDKLMIQGVGSSQKWHALIEKVAVQTPLHLTTSADPYLPTDAMSFYLAEIPVITLFTGAHGDYHTPRDTAELINYAGLYQITKLTKKLIREISHKPLKWDYQKIEATNKGSRSKQFRVYLGTIPDYSQQGVVGVRLSGVTAGGPAAKAGLIEQDIIVELAGKKIENMYDYVYALQALRANEEAILKVQRQDQLLELKVVPLAKEE
jgi:Tol biopolymer transport system component